MSVSGIGESTLADVDAFCAEMDARSVPVSLLVAPRIARRGGVVRIAVAARHLRKSGPLQAMLDAVDLAMLQGCTPMVYRWRADAAVLDAA